MNEFITEIECEGNEYELDISAIFEAAEGALPDRINLSIQITQIIAGERRPVDKLLLEYVVETKEYNSITIGEQTAERVDLNLFDCIIKTLDETYMRWGNEGQ